MPTEAYRELLVQMRAESTSIEGELSECSAAFRTEILTVTLERVQRAIPAGAVLQT